MRKHLFECDFCGDILREHEAVITIKNIGKSDYDLCLECVKKNYKPGTSNPFYFLIEREGQIWSKNMDSLCGRGKDA